MFKITLLLSSVLLIAQCASLGGTYEKEKVQKIKKIAVVGFSYDAQLETSGHIMSALMGNEKGTGPGLMGNFKSEHAEKETPTSQLAYDGVVSSLKKTGWQVKSASEVQSSAAVKAFYNKSVKVGMLPLDKGSARYEREGIPQYVHVASLAGKGELAKMARDLGVDAVAVAYVQAKGSATIPFVSKITHSATVLLQVFDPASDKLIFLFSSEGKEVGGTTKTKIGKDFVADIQKGTLASIEQFGADIVARLQK